MTFYPGFHPDLLDTLSRREVDTLVVAMEQEIRRREKG